MGALTQKAFPHKIRGWDFGKSKHFDPTDPFASSVSVYVKGGQILQIEPEYDNNSMSVWVSDKCRQFFDDIFANQIVQKFTSGLWSKACTMLIKNIYAFNICKNQFHNDYFFTIVFENISVEILSLLIMISKKYSFIKIRKAENFFLNNNLESDFQLNGISNQTKLNKSSTCFLIATNTRYQGYKLNLNLRQRFFKGNFNCLILGSLVDITFPTAFIGSSTKIIKNIVEGSSLSCNRILRSKYPLAVFNDEILKRSSNVVNLLKPFTKRRVNVNTLNSTIYSTSNFNISSFSVFNEKDSFTFNNLSLIGIQRSQKTFLRKITCMRLLNNNFNNKTQLNINKILINQNFYDLKKYLKPYTKVTRIFLPTSHLFQNAESFVNTEGTIARVNSLLFDKETMSHFEILKNLTLNLYKTDFMLLSKDRFIISFDNNIKSVFKNVIDFMFFANNTLNTNLLAKTKNKSFFIYKQTAKSDNRKITVAKLKHWLNDFFTGGKDDFSPSSRTLINCSISLRLESTNFF